MNKLTQKEAPEQKAMSAKIPEDCWELVRRDAFERKISITQALAEIIRGHYATPRRRTA